MCACNEIAPDNILVLVFICCKEFSPDVLVQGTTSGLFVSAPEWVTAVTYTQISRSVFSTIAASVVLSATAVFIFSGRPFLTLFAGFTLLLICVTVMGILYLWDWTLGAIEAMSITSLVGLAVDFCIHIVEGYMAARAGDRRGNARCALQHLGGAPRPLAMGDSTFCKVGLQIQIRGPEFPSC
jgi:predicted RND superfamily exporter protein